MDIEIKRKILGFQRNEITEHYVYRMLSWLAKGERNREVLRRISDEEKKHYGIWKGYTGEEVGADRWKCFYYTFISAVFGITFGIKLMERGERRAQDSYNGVAGVVAEAAAIERDEEEHEGELIAMVDEEKLKYMGSVVLGLNDALVEFTGALAGFTFALGDVRVIGMVGLIMGVSASLSMAASEYLSTKTDGGEKKAGKSAIYTGAAYMVTVAVLVSPFFVSGNHFLSLGCTVGLAVLMIGLFTFYSSVVKGKGFLGRFLEMVGISMGVAGLSFVIGLLVKKGMGVEA